MPGPVHVVYVAPYFSANILQCLDGLLGLPDVRVGVISHEAADRMPMPQRGRLAGHYQVQDCLDEGQVAAATHAFQKEWGRVDRLIGFLEQMQLPLAIARDRTGVPGMSGAIARNFREKNRMKEVLRDAGLPVAGQRLIHGPDEARAMVAAFGYPIVIKPPAGLGSRGTMRVTDEEELQAALAALMVSPSNPAQAEQFISGEEHTFETVTIRGEPVWHSSSYYLPGPLAVLEHPWMQYCVLLPRERLQPHAERFRPINVAALQALGMGTGLSHMEWFLRADGSAIVSEVGARPPGVHLMPMMGMCHEVDMWAKWAELLVHERFSVPERQWSCGAAFFRGQGVGHAVRSVEGFERAAEVLGDRLVEHRLPRPGTPRASGYEGEGYAIVRARTTQEVVEGLRLLVTQTRVTLA